MNNEHTEPSRVTNDRDKVLQIISSHAVMAGKLKASPDLKASLFGETLRRGGL